MRTILVLVVAAGLTLAGFVLAETQRGPAEHAPRAPEEQSLSQKLQRQEMRQLQRLEERLEERAEAVMQRKALHALVRTGECEELGDVSAEIVQRQRGPQARWGN